jgi:LmbE family N-acetylglucosaminyl deacetylase
MGRPVVFVTPHPDDEVLGFSVQLWRHVAAGRDVHILALTRGIGTRVIDELNGTTVNTNWWKVRHNPALEGYAPLDPAAIGRARMREQQAACAAAGIPASHIHEANLPDDLNVTVDQVKEAIVALADILPPDPGLWATSYLVDGHPTHLAAGQAVRELGREQPTRFRDRRYVVLRTYWNDPRLAQVAETVGGPASAEERDRTINAARAYGAWQPRSGAFAIGNHSTSTLFGLALTDPKVMVHRDS